MWCISYCSWQLFDYYFFQLPSCRVVYQLLFLTTVWLLLVLAAKLSCGVSAAVPDKLSMKLIDWNLPVDAIRILWWNIKLDISEDWEKYMFLFWLSRVNLYFGCSYQNLKVTVQEYFKTSQWILLIQGILII